MPILVSRWWHSPVSGSGQAPLLSKPISLATKWDDHVSPGKGSARNNSAQCFPGLICSRCFRRQCWKSGTWDLMCLWPGSPGTELGKTSSSLCWAQERRSMASAQPGPLPVPGSSAFQRKPLCCYSHRCSCSTGGTHRAVLPQGRDRWWAWMPHYRLCFSGEPSLVGWSLRSGNGPLFHAFLCLCPFH